MVVLAILSTELFILDPLTESSYIFAGQTLS